MVQTQPQCYSSAMKILIKWLLSAASLLFVAYVYSGVEVQSFTSALIAAFVIGLFNVVLRPVLVLLTLPVTIVTLGLFLFVINALMFWAAATVLAGFQVNGFIAALVGSLIYSVLGVLIESALGGLFSKK
jgi:putative membrane protein